MQVVEAQCSRSWRLTITRISRRSVRAAGQVTGRLLDVWRIWRACAAGRLPARAEPRWWRVRCGGCGSARGEDVELVALRVGQAGPRHVALADVDAGGAERPQPGHLRRLVVTGVGPQVEMDPVLHGLDAGGAEELQVRADARGGAQRRMVAGHLAHRPVH